MNIFTKNLNLNNFFSFFLWEGGGGGGRVVGRTGPSQFAPSTSLKSGA